MVYYVCTAKVVGVNTLGFVVLRENTKNPRPTVPYFKYINRPPDVSCPPKIKTPEGVIVFHRAVMSFRWWLKETDYPFNVVTDLEDLSFLWVKPKKIQRFTFHEHTPLDMMTRAHRIVEINRLTKKRVLFR